MGALDVGAETTDGAESQCPHLIAARVPGAVLEAVRHVLREDRHGVLASGRDGVVMCALEVEFAPKMLGQVAALGGVERGLPLGVSKGRVDLAKVVGFVLTRAREEIRQL